MTIPGVSSINAIEAVRGLGSVALPKAEPGAFQKVLQSAISSVESNRTAADQSVQQFLSGEGGDLHKVILTTQKAELSFELFQQVRNKVTQAYQEIMRMQL